MDIMGDVNAYEAALVLSMIAYVGCDGKKKRYMAVQEDLLRNYAILKRIGEVEK